jgi:two-component system sensor histidine kinase PhoQ
MAFLQPKDPGSPGFNRQVLDGEELYILNFGVLWEDDEGRELRYTLAVAEGTAGMMSQVEGFRARLLYWLGGVAVLLLIAQGVVLGWGLRPLRRVAVDLHRVEAGEISALGGRYPEELQGLVGNLNALIRSGRASRDRYRNSLGDLAHSLKTPLTLLQGTMETEDCDQLRQTVRQQVPRMDEIVRYQLRRAATSGAAEPGMSVPVLPVVRRLMATLGKVYRDKGIECQLSVGESVRFFGDEGDLMEFLGNLMENGFKYGKRRVRVKAYSEQPEKGGQPSLAIDIEDDGPGIPDQMRDEVLNRGARIDQQIPGQGIGLSVASEIVGIYRGKLKIGESDMGGAAIHLRFPSG